MIGNGTPIGVKLYSKAGCPVPQVVKQRRDKWYQGLVFSLSYIIYTAYRILRKAPSVIKNVLNQNCTGLEPPADLEITTENIDTWCNWPPYDGDNADSLLGATDAAMLSGYAIGMFITGWLSDRLPVRLVLTFTMLLTALVSTLYGLEYYFHVQHIAYFLSIQVLNGIFQSGGYPACCKCLGQWFNNNRGVIFGVWNSNGFIGNILGNLIAGSFVDYNWSLSLIVPSIIIATCGILCFLFLPAHPDDVSCEVKEKKDVEKSEKNEITSERVVEKTDVKPITILEALKVPGVIEYSCSIFCAKLVAYTFTFWLPRYINLTSTLSATNSAFLSSMFDVGGIIGTALIGLIADKIGSGAIASGSMLLLAFPSIYIYQEYGNNSIGINVFLLIIVGLLINGPYNLITSVIPTDLGTHESLRGNKEAMSTMVGIINGCGSLGAALGPLLAGILTDKDVTVVFWMIMAFNLGSLLFLTRLITKDIRACGRRLQEEDLVECNKV